MQAGAAAMEWYEAKSMNVRKRKNLGTYTKRSRPAERDSTDLSALRASSASSGSSASSSNAPLAWKASEDSTSVPVKARKTSGRPLVGGLVAKLFQGFGTFRGEIIGESATLGCVSIRDNTPDRQLLRTNEMGSSATVGFEY